MRPALSTEHSPTRELYLNEIARHSLLSAKEERELAQRIALGDEAARQRFIQANLKLVVKIAQEYQGHGLSLDDLIGEGNLGLIRAIKDFDPAFGTRFSTYAYYWIKQAIRHALTNLGGTIRIPARMIRWMRDWHRTETELYSRFGFDPSADEIADELGLSEIQCELVLSALRATRLRGSQELTEDEYEWSPDEAIDPSPPPETLVEHDDLYEEVMSRLTELQPVEQEVIRLRFGIEGGQPLTLWQIGERVGLTKEWVRKIESRALRRLEGQGTRTLCAQPTNPGPAKHTKRDQAEAVPSRPHLRPRAKRGRQSAPQTAALCFEAV